MRKIKITFVFLIALLLMACVGMPKDVTPVKPFDLNRYLGKWYEIARLDHSFERGLEKVTAEYALREDGGVSVINRGYSPKDDKWKVAEGKAFFVNDDNEGYFKVSFFGPFYGSYVIFELDDNYEYAFISGPNTSYLWLLSRTPTLSPKIIDSFKQRANELSFDIKNLIMVNHE